MDYQVTNLIETVRRQNRLEMTLRMYDGEGYAPIGLDIRGLDAVLFAAGTAEFVYSYASYLFGENEKLPYQAGVFLEFEQHLSRKIGGLLRPSWVDLYEERRDYERIFRDQFYRRTGGLWSVGAGDLLRIELVEISKVNPTILKIIATGTMAAVILLSGCVGATWVMKEKDADQCRIEQINSGRELTHMVLVQAKLEGKFTAEHREAVAKIQDATGAYIAACGSSLDDVKIDLDPHSGRFIFRIGGEPKK